MAALDVTEANVVRSTPSTVIDGIAGGTITQGMPVYKDATAQNKYKAAVNTSMAAAEAVGIALNAASDGQPLKIQTAGKINMGATLVVGETYCVGDAAGAVAPIADVGAAEFSTILGQALTASILELNIQSSGVAHG